MEFLGEWSHKPRWICLNLSLVGTRPPMGPTAELEREIKFEAPLGLALPDLRPLVGRTVRLPEEHLVTTYLETSDRRLWHEGLTLRYRTTKDSGDGTWTLKVPHDSNGPGLERTEVSCPGQRDEVPKGLQSVLRGVLRREPLRPLVTLETTRQRLALHGDRDQRLAELDDDLVLVVGGLRDGLQFRQVELELLEQGWEGHEVIRHLEAAGARVGLVPKLAKAVDLPPGSSSKLRVTKRVTLATVVQAAVRSGLDRLVRYDWSLRLAGSEPARNDVHRARVATRRLRSDLKTFGSILDPMWTRHVRSDLKWLGTALGEVRDVDVLAEQLADAPPALEQRLAEQRAAATGRLSEVLESGRYLDLLNKLHAASERLPLAEGAAPEAQRAARNALPTLVHARWRAVRRQVRRAGPKPSATQLHHIRIKAKQLRYAAEAAAPVVGRPAKRTASAAEHIQTVLGQHHDAVACETWLRGQVKLPVTSGTVGISPSIALEVGRFLAEARRRRQEARGKWNHAWSRLAKSKRRRWLRKS